MSSLPTPPLVLSGPLSLRKVPGQPVVLRSLLHPSGELWPPPPCPACLHRPCPPPASLHRASSPTRPNLHCPSSPRSSPPRSCLHPPRPPAEPRSCLHPP